MYAPERQQEIVERARVDGRVDVTELAATLEVTTETVRRDLSVLERHGVLRRVHGGAIPVERIGFGSNGVQRDTGSAAERDRIAKEALRHVPDRSAILLDADATTARLAENLPAECDLTVVTNAAPLAVTLAARPRITVLLLGGRIHGPDMAALEEWTLRELGDTRVEVAFLGAGGVSPAHGLTVEDTRDAAVKRAMIDAARRVVVLAEHTKLDTDCLARFGGLDQVDTVITDSGADDEQLRQLAAAGPDVIRA